MAATDRMFGHLLILSVPDHIKPYATLLILVLVLGYGTDDYAPISTVTMIGSILSITNTQWLHPSPSITATLSGKTLTCPTNGSGFVNDAVLLTKP